MIVKYYDFNLDILDETAEILKNHYVSWGWTPSGSLCCRFDFQKNVRHLINSHSDPSIASTIYAQLMTLQSCKGTRGNGRFIFDNFDIS